MFGESVTRRRRTPSTPDRYGNPTYTWSTATLDGAAFDPGGSTEPVEVGRTQTVTTPRLFFRATVDVRAGDEIVVRGVAYTVEGTPATWVSPWSQRTAGVAVELRAVTG